VVVVFGSVNLDLVAHVERLPRAGETVLGTSFAMNPGGKGANQALAASRAGAHVALYAAVGHDAFAQAALAGLRGDGVDLAGVVAVAAPTGVALIAVNAKGENCISVVAGANAHATGTLVPESALDGDTTLVLQLETPLKSVASVAARAHSRGARTILNAAPAARLPAALIRALDVLIVNQREAAVIAEVLDAPSGPSAFCRELWRKYAIATVVTVGKRGAIAVAEDRRYQIPAPEMHVVDTVGAGDAFVGTLAAALDRRTPWPRALAAAVAAGSLACTTRGAQTALPRRAAIEKLAGTIESRIVSDPGG
jgi:ribokinase